MGSRKSSTCFGKSSRSALTEYDSAYEAKSAAEYVSQIQGERFTYYECRNCGRWHLAPASRQTPSTTCPYCVDGCGAPKEAYLSYEGANTRARILQNEKGVVLRPYECPAGMGWHLTKS